MRARLFCGAIASGSNSTACRACFSASSSLAKINNHPRQQIVRGRIRGRKFFGAPQFAQAFGKFPLRKKANPTEGRVRLGQRRRDRDGFLRISCALSATPSYLRP